jgi:predicted exporter
VLPYSMLVLGPQQLDAVARSCRMRGIRSSVERNRTLLQTPQSTVAKQFVRVDPFNLLPIYLEKLKRASGGLNADFSSGYYVSTDHTAALIIAKPRKAAQDLPFSRQVMNETKEIVAQAVKEFRASQSERRGSDDRFHRWLRDRGRRRKDHPPGHGAQ